MSKVTSSRVWVLGDAVVDLIPNGETNYLKCPGGAPANVAVGIARLQGDAAFIGRVGQDPLGRFMQSTLQSEDVNTDQMVLDDQQRTSTVIVDLDDSGERSFTFMVKPSADQFLLESDLPVFKQGEWLHCCSIALANQPSRLATFAAMNAVKAVGGFVSFDPNLRDEVWENSSEIKPNVLKAVRLANVLKFSEEELTFLTGESVIEAGLQSLNLASNTLAIVTLGAKGAYVYFNGENLIISGIKVTPIDTTGAGDGFVSGLLAYLSSQDDWCLWPVVEKAVEYGNACGALVTKEKGAMTALPTLHALKLKL